MLKNIGQVAGPKALLLQKTPSKAAETVRKEQKHFSIFLKKFSPNLRYKSNYPTNSILFRALSSNDFKDEDILSESILLLNTAIETYEEKVRDVEFTPFAIIYIRESIKSIKSKNTHTNSSDLNELIHSAIRYIKKNNHYQRLSHNQILKLISHFKLDQIKGYKKIVEFENIQKGTGPLEVQNTDTNNGGSFDNYNILEDNKFANYEYVYNKSFYTNPEKILEASEDLKVRFYISKFVKYLNKRERKIFIKRIFNSKEEFLNLKSVAMQFRVSPQAINKTEIKLKNKLKSFLRLKIVDKNLNAVK